MACEMPWNMTKPVGSRGRSKPQILVAWLLRKDRCNGPAMGTKSREVIWGGEVWAAKVNADSARQPPRKPLVRPIVPRLTHGRCGRLRRPCAAVPTIAQCLNGGLGWLEVECNRCKTRASLPLA